MRILNKKKIGVIALIACIALGIGIMVSGFQPDDASTDADNSDGCITCGSEDDGYFYSESDGREITRGPHWNPADSTNHFSVRYIGMSEDKPDNIKDIYICVQDIYADQTLSLDLQMYNHENRELYFTIQDNGTNLTGQTADYALYPDNSASSDKEMGSVAGDGAVDDTWTYTINANNIPSSLGSAENTDTVDLRISSWEDSSYETLYTRDNFDIRIHYVDREDSAWTVVDNDFFDDGTVQGWNVETGTGKDDDGSITISANNTIYRTENYSLGVGAGYGGSYTNYISACAYKSFSVSGTSAYMIATFWTEGHGGGTPSFGIHENDSVVAPLPLPPTDVWHQIVIPLTTDGNPHKVEFYDICGEYKTFNSTNYAYIDDVYVIQRS